MIALANPFSRRPRDGYPELIVRFKAFTAKLLDLDDAATISISELACRDPGCPGVETIIAVLRQGQPPRLLRIRKPLREIEDDDIEAAASS